MVQEEGGRRVVIGAGGGEGIELRFVQQMKMRRVVIGAAEENAKSCDWCRRGKIKVVTDV